MILDLLKLVEEIVKELISYCGDELRLALEKLLRASMKIESDQAFGTSSNVLNEQRWGYVYGFKAKESQPSMGLFGRISQAKGITFFPCFIERGARLDKPLKLAIAEINLSGLSSRLTQEIDEEFKKFRNRPFRDVCYLSLILYPLRLNQELCVKMKAQAVEKYQKNVPVTAKRREDDLDKGFMDKWKTVFRNEPLLNKKKTKNLSVRRGMGLNLRKKSCFINK